MIFVQEKIKNNKRVLFWTLCGLIGTLMVMSVMWFSIMCMVLEDIDFKWFLPFIFVIFWTYITASIIRGKELSSIGLDLNNMDDAEIDITIALLEKEKRKRDVISNNTKLEFIKTKKGDKNENIR